MLRIRGGFGTENSRILGSWSGLRLFPESGKSPKNNSNAFTCFYFYFSFVLLNDNHGAISLIWYQVFRECSEIFPDPRYLPRWAQLTWLCVELSYPIRKKSILITWIFGGFFREMRSYGKYQQKSHLWLERDLGDFSSYCRIPTAYEE